MASSDLYKSMDANVHSASSSKAADDGIQIGEAPVSGNSAQAPPANSDAAGVDSKDLGETIDEMDKKPSWYAYFLTKEFYIVLILGQTLALCQTATNTFTTKLGDYGTSMPALQSLFNYCLLTLVYTTYTIYRYGFKKYFRLLLVDGWKYIILSFFDVEGNYFTVLAYEYTNMLSAQLLNYWAIVCVVIFSFFVLRVRYRIPQIAGILICCGGMGILLASDHIQGTNGGPAANKVKGDLFALAGATLYGLTNATEEWFVSKRPMYEVLGMLGLFGIIISGVTCAIFDRDAVAGATWNGPVAGYLVGYTLCLSLFYSLAPIIFRMASAAFFNISMLTGNFWGTIIGIHVFGYSIYFLYPIAFVLILIGQVVYFLAGTVLGESRKPWLGHDQEAGVAGIGTAKHKAMRAAKRQQQDARV